MIHACVLDMVPNFDVTLPFIDCMQTDLYGRRKPNVDAVAKKVSGEFHESRRVVQEECPLTGRQEMSFEANYLDVTFDSKI